jgi:hypothetical protein
LEGRFDKVEKKKEQDVFQIYVCSIVMPTILFFGSCESLPKTHAVVKFFRAILDFVRPNTFIVAEGINWWDVQIYVCINIDNSL